MKKLMLTISILLVAQMGMGQSMKNLKWLDGNWQRQNTKAGQTAYESWTKSQNEWVGMGITLKGADTVFVEKLKIVSKDGDLHYVAEVGHNAGPVYFKITSMDKTGFVSENPAHDFPKKITYQLDDDQMTATISGDGKAIPFVFKRVK